MTRTVHPPEWPDKVMFAAMLLVMAGIFGAVFALLRLAGLTIDKGVSSILYVTPPAASLALSLAALGLGLFGIRHQAAFWVWFGVVCGILSMGMLGITPLLSLVAIGFLIRSHLEGEATYHSDATLDASLWPDKALAASLVLFVAAVVALFQGALLLADDIILAASLRSVSNVLGVACLVSGLWSLYAAREIYRLRRPWAGYTAAALNILTLGFGIVGPAMGIAAFVLLQKARAEDEFEGAATPA